MWGVGVVRFYFFIPICFRAHYSNFSVKTSAPEKVLVPCAVQYVLPLSLKRSERDSIFAPSEPLIPRTSLVPRRKEMKPNCLQKSRFTALKRVFTTSLLVSQVTYKVKWVCLTPTSSNCDNLVSIEALQPSKD